MFELFDLNKDYYFPNGRKMTKDDLNENAQYAVLKTRPFVADVTDGILKTYFPLSDFVSRYGIEYTPDDAEVCFSKAIEIYNYRKNNPPLTITDTVRKAATFAALSFTDEQALEVSDLYPVYEVDHDYKQNDRFTYNGRLFKVNQDHTSAAQWVPGETGTESLYTCLEMAGDGYLVWTQPTGAHNAYNTGDIVHYPTKDDQLYKSLIDGNTTVPGSDERWWETYTTE